MFLVTTGNNSHVFQWYKECCNHPHWFTLFPKANLSTHWTIFDDGVHMYVTVKVTYNRPTETESGIKE